MVSQNFIDNWILEFQKLDKKFTKLPVDIYFGNDLFLSQKYKISPMIFIINGYKDEFWENSYLAISIDKYPEILSDVEIKLFKKDLNVILNFISKFYATFLDAFYEKIGYFDVSKKIKMITESFSLNEMAKFRSSESGLPFDIWLDTDKLYKEHGEYGYRIKFKGTDGNDETRNWPSIKLSDYEIIGKNANYPKKDLKKLYNFIYFNKDLIQDLADKKIEMNEFKNAVHKINDKGSPELSANEEVYVLYDRLDDFYSIVVDRSKTKFNIRKDLKNELLFNEWFDQIIKKRKINKYGETCYFATKGEKAYEITTDGKIYPIY